MKKLIISLLIASSISLVGCSNATTTTTRNATAKKKQPQAMADTLPQTSNIKYYFTRADQHPDIQLINVIDSSKSSLDIAIYSLTKKSIVDSIIQAKERGVAVRIMTDKIESKSKSEAKELKLLEAANIPIKINSHSGLLHIKMTIADDSVATTGSYNYTQAASVRNDEILVIISDSKIARDFETEFNSMWSNNKDYKDYN